MSSANPFDLLGDDDNDDPSQLIALQQQKISVKKPAASATGAPAPPAKLPSKPLPPAQAVRETRSGNTAPAQAGTGRGGAGRGGSGRGAGFVQSRDLGNRTANGYSGGGAQEAGDTGRTSERGRGSYGSPRELFSGGRNGGLGNGDADEGKSDPDHPQKRVYDRRNGTGRGFGMKRDGAGRGNWGTMADDYLPQGTEEGVDKENAVNFEKTYQKDGKANEASSDKKDDAAKRGGEEEPEDNEMTLEEYEKVREEKRKALLSMKAEERRVVVDKDFEAMQQLSVKKGNDDIFIKVGSEDSSKRRENAEKEERSRKAVPINEFLKPLEGERSYGAGGRGRGRGRGSFGGGYVGGGGPASSAAPLIEDPSQFPTLGAK